MSVGIPQPGDVIDGAYRVIETLGSGAMGVVLLAQDLKLDRNVAIKLVRASGFEAADSRARFLAEARSMARVNHPNVLQIHSLGEHLGAPYFVSELVDGLTAEDWVGSFEDAPPDRATALAILDDVCRGVAAIHAAGTIHRDIKSGNVLLDLNLRARVADLGLSIARGETASGEDVIVGTPAYMAPEITLQRALPPELAHRADIYALGCLACELLTGKLPFQAVGTLPMMVKHTNTPAPRPSELSPALGQAFDAIVLEALAKEPAERTATAEAFRQGLIAAAQAADDPARILLVEDDEDFRDALTLALRQEFPAAHIEATGDGHAGLAAFIRVTPSIALIDFQMPGLDGLALTSALRALPAADKVPVLVLTASGGPKEWQQLKAAGADGFLVKPVNLKDVAVLVRRAIADRR